MVSLLAVPRSKASIYGVILLIFLTVSLAKHAAYNYSTLGQDMIVRIVICT